MVNFTLRSAQPEDAPALATLEKALFSEPYSAASCASLIASPLSLATLAVGEDGTVLGYLLAQFIAPEGELFTIATRKDCRRCGIARALMRHLLCEARARGCTVLYLEVRVSNTAAIALYKAFGFKAIGTRRDYYRAPREDACIMQCALQAFS